MKVTGICLILYVLHVLVAHLLLPSVGRSDISPLYDWNLFSFVPPSIDRMVIQVHDLDGVKLPDQILKFHNYDPASLLIATHLIQRFGIAVVEQSDSQALFQREMEKSLFSKNTSAVYELKTIKIHLRDHFLKKDPGVSESLGVFNYQREY